MKTWLKLLEQLPKIYLAPICIIIILVVGLVDLWTGYEKVFFIFYLISVFLGVWYVSVSFGALMSALSVAAWISTNLEAGARYSSYLVPVWNALIMFSFYLVVVFLLARLKRLNLEMEARVRQRTAALAQEVEQRMQLQREILSISDRVRQNVGHELHDGLSQHLTGTALVGHSTSEKLSQKAAPEAAEVARLVQLVEAAIEMTRALARRLSPVELMPGRLAENFQELATLMAARCKVDCTYAGPAELPALPVETALHIYHSAEEAITNAARHGRAHRIVLRLELAAQALTVSVEDDGVGLPERLTEGLGLRILRYRADLIGARLALQNQPGGGAQLTCVYPLRRSNDV